MEGEPRLPSSAMGSGTMSLEMGRMGEVLPNLELIQEEEDMGLRHLGALLAAEVGRHNIAHMFF